MYLQIKKNLKILKNTTKKQIDLIVNPTIRICTIHNYYIDQQLTLMRVVIPII